MSIMPERFNSTTAPKGLTVIAGGTRSNMRPWVPCQATADAECDGVPQATGCALPWGHRGNRLGFVFWLRAPTTPEDGKGATNE